MPTSGDNTFQVTRDQLIKSSLEDVGAIEFGTTVPANLETMAQLELNKEVQRLQAEGVKLWSREYVTGSTLTSGQQLYVLADTDILNIDGINVIEGTAGNKISYQVNMVDIDKFFSDIGQHETDGRPTYCAVQPVIDGNEYKFQLRFWPTPNEDFEYEYLAVKKLDGFTGGGNTPAFPARWYDALQYGLSMRLAPKFGNKGDRLGYFRKMYAEAKDMAKKTEYTHRSSIMKGAYSYGRGRI